PDTVEVGRLGEARRRADRPLELERGLLGLFDSLRILGQPERDEPLAKILEVAASRPLLGQFAERDDRGRAAHDVSAPHLGALVVEHEPGPLLAADERAEVRALVRLGLRRHDAFDLLTLIRERRSRRSDAIEVLPEPHGASLDSGAWPLS